MRLSRCARAALRAVAMVVCLLASTCLVSVNAIDCGSNTIKLVWTEDITGDVKSGLSGTTGESYMPKMVLQVQQATDSALCDTGTAASTFVTFKLTAGSPASSKFGLASTGGTVGGKYEGTATGGIFTFDTTSKFQLEGPVSTGAANYQVSATAGAVTGLSTAFKILEGDPTELKFSTQLNSIVAGSTVTWAITVVDSFGNRCTSKTSGNVDFSLKDGVVNPDERKDKFSLNPSQCTLSQGTCTLSAVLKGYANPKYIIVATENTIGSVESREFAIYHSDPTQLAFLRQPSPTVIENEVFFTQPQVQFLDEFLGPCNTTTGVTIQLQITGGTGNSSGLLLGNVFAPSVNGVVTFSDLKFTLASMVAYSITAKSGALTAAISSDIICQRKPGTPTKLEWKKTPSTAASSGTVFNQQPEVSIIDDKGYTILTMSDKITMSIKNTTYLGNSKFPKINNIFRVPKLYGNTVVASNQGVASFTNLFLDVAYDDYTLVASYGCDSKGQKCALPSIETQGIAVTAGIAKKLIFSLEPNEVEVEKVNFAFAPQVQFSDAYSNLVSSTSANVTLTIKPGTATDGAVLTGVVNRLAVGGVVSFPLLKIDKAGKFYQLTATPIGTTGVDPGDSRVINVVLTFGAATRLVFLQQPGPANGVRTVSTGLPFARQPMVKIMDASARTVVTPEQEITLFIKAGTGYQDSKLLGTTTIKTRFGIATFTDVGINLPKKNYALTASCDFLKLTVDSTYLEAEVNAPVSIAFRDHPSTVNEVNRPLFTNPSVAVVDPVGNSVPWAVSSITLTLLDIKMQATGAKIVAGYSTMSALKGLATFPGLAVDTIGEFRLFATSGWMGTTVSNPFFIQMPSSNRVVTNLKWSIAPPITVAAKTKYSSPVLVSIINSNGVIVINPIGTYTIKLKMFMLDESTPEKVWKSMLITQGYEALFAVSRGGVATFSDLYVDNLGTYKTEISVVETNHTLTSSNMQVIAGNPAKWVILQDPSMFTTTGGPFATQPWAKVVDMYGNTVVQNIKVTASIKPGTGPASGSTLKGTTVVDSKDGIVKFTNLQIDEVGSGYVLVLSSEEVPLGYPVTVNTTALAMMDPAVLAARPKFVVSFAFTYPAVIQMSSGDPVSIKLLSQPPDVLQYTVFSNPMRVGLFDVKGVCATDSKNQKVITVTVTSKKTKTVKLSGTTQAIPVSCIAIFKDLTVDTPCQDCQLVFSAEGLSTATTAAFAVTGQPNTIRFKTSPLYEAVGIHFEKPMEVEIIDKDLNLIPFATDYVTVELNANPQQALIQGTLRRQAKDGVVKFDDLSVDTMGPEYQITASITMNNGKVVKVTSAVFDVMTAEGKRIKIQKEFATPIPAANDPSVVVPSLLSVLFMVATIGGICYFYCRAQHEPGLEDNVPLPAVPKQILARFHGSLKKQQADIAKADADGLDLLDGGGPAGADTEGGFLEGEGEVPGLGLDEMPGLGADEGSTVIQMGERESSLLGGTEDDLLLPGALD